MESIIAVVDDHLENPGDTFPVRGHIQKKSYTQGGREFVLADGLDYDLVLTNAGEGILATGMVQAHVIASCDRCLGPAEFDIAGEVDEYFLFHEPAEPLELGDDEDEVDYSLVADDGSIDLSDAIASAVVMETPFIVLCKEDCKGLCPVCGENLNEVDCGHVAQLEQEREQERLDASPFAVLKQLKLEDD